MPSDYFPAAEKKKPPASVKSQLDRLEAVIDAEIDRLERQANVGHDVDLVALEKLTKTLLAIEKRNKENQELDNTERMSKEELKHLLSDAKRAIKDIPDDV